MSVWNSELLAVLVCCAAFPRELVSVTGQNRLCRHCLHSAKLSFFSIQRLLKAREDWHFSLKTQINATIRYGVDAIRAVFFSLLTLPAVHFLNKSRQRQSPGDSAAFPERISMDSARLLVRSVRVPLHVQVSNRATPPLSEPS